MASLLRAALESQLYTEAGRQLYQHLAREVEVAVARLWVLGPSDCRYLPFLELDDAVRERRGEDGSASSEEGDEL